MTGPRPAAPGEPADARLTVGVDVVSVPRIARLLERSPTAERRLFTPREIAICQRGARRSERFAARFAGKEALLKALHAPYGQILRLTDIEIGEVDGGRPAVRFRGRLAPWTSAHGVRTAQVSLTHDGDTAAAYAAVTWRPPPRTARWFERDQVAAALRFARSGGIALHRFRWDLRRFGLSADEPACHVLSTDVAALVEFGAALELHPKHLQPPPAYRPDVWHFDAFGPVLERLEAAHPPYVTRRA